MRREIAAIVWCVIAWTAGGCAASYTRDAADGGAPCEVLPDPTECRPAAELGGFVWEETRYWRQERWIWVGSLETGHWDYALSAPAVVESSPRESGCLHGRNGSGVCCDEGCVCGGSCIRCEHNCAVPNILTGSASRTIARAEQLPCGRDGYERFQATGPFACAEEITILGCDCPPDLSGACSDTLVTGASVHPLGLNTTCMGPRPSSLPAFITRDVELSAVLNVLACCASE